MLTIDDAESILNKIINETKTNLDQIASEEDAKIQIINRILVESLGWSFSDISAETSHENGYSDYILRDNREPILLIEAKRIGKIDINVADKNKVKHLKISGSSLKPALQGINQAASYSLTNGIPVTILTDGIIWIVFKTFIPGKSFKEVEAIVFPSFESIVSDFSTFFDLLSKTQSRKKIYNTVFDGIHHNRLLLTQSLIAPIEESDIKLTQKSEIAFDLDKVFNSFFSRLAGDDDENLLIECFVETRESIIADYSLEKMTKNVLGNVISSDKNIDSVLSALISTEVDGNEVNSESGETIFIVGPTGSGKSTFLDRFFRKTLPSQIRKKCILVKVNCLDATGIEENVLGWTLEQIIKELEEHVYEGGSPCWDELRALYNGEYMKRSKGVDAKLFESNKIEFEKKFGSYLEQKVENDREGYAKRILEDIVKNRKKLPVFVIDNTDEFSIEYKKQIYQLAQSLRRHAKHCMLLFPVTDKSAWSFSKTDIFGIYESRSFFLPTPSPREVFRKRIDFLKLKISKDGEIKSKKEYFSGKGIKISIENLNGFAQVLENIFVDHDYTSKTIGELTNYNIRKTLLLSQRVITSPVIKIEDLIKSYIAGKSVTTNYSRFMDALLKGDFEAFKCGDANEIYPIFKVDSEVRQSPLLNLRILSLLDSTYKNGRTAEEKYLDINSIVSYFDAIGCSEASVYKSLSSMFEAGLIEPYDISVKEIQNIQKFSISYKGKAHLRLSQNGVFFYQMALTTATRDADLASQIRSTHDADINFNEKVDSIKNDFLKFIVAEDKSLISNMIDAPQYVNQREIIESLAKFSQSESAKDNEVVELFGEHYKQGLIRKEVIATVNFYDVVKGFGFVEVEGLDARIFIHSEKLHKHGVKSLKDGDSILCDISRGHKGIHVETIHDIETDSSKITISNCEVVRLFPERGYGFSKFSDDKKAAFFHVTIFKADEREKLCEGYKFKSEIGPDRKGDGYQVMKILHE